MFWDAYASHEPHVSWVMKAYVPVLPSHLSHRPFPARYGTVAAASFE